MNNLRRLAIAHQQEAAAWYEYARFCLLRGDTWAAAYYHRRAAAASARVRQLMGLERK